MTILEEHPVIQNGKHAIVIGGSMAGLLAARVLTAHFDRVTVIERDQLPEQPELRQGVPQASHVHVLLTKGQHILEQLFPGLEAELGVMGAPEVNWTNDCPWFGFEGWMPRSSSGLTTRPCSRVLLEWLVRRRLTTFPNLKFLEACQVKGLLTNDRHTKVTGVKLLDRNYNQSDALAADLVVDASGRNSLLPQWLTALGYSSPTKTVINSFLGYSTRWYERPEGFQADWKAMVIMSKPPHERRGGVIVPVEGNRWALTVSGVGGDYPPTEEAGFLEFVRSLRNPILYDVIKEAKPLSPVYGYRRTENCWQHYETLARLPQGIVAIGDSVCAFNPVYGQGMTTAALGAQILDRCLHQQFRCREDVTGLSQRFQKQLAQVLETPWLMATGEDFRWETTEGGQPGRMTRFMHRYMDRVVQFSINQPQVYRTFIEVAHMIKSPVALFSPKIVLGVLSLKVNSL
ncbi:MAG: 2-polyprenyl-6-methoxyphenol hydroxylase-like oxidoreductase [Cyanobacteria bacterium CRU_2_1]|nr:2-polyprenyl-6-methoxyphenol hydroxylase-like oxidoreductase [Cyanobacteria bacterium RU_5_0]NJR59018.1 2-polyprenyl-6-methoxyphenol hydroxylase-like oxidoreductase [Cyanobacteria bacterium CRU_2_1]